MTTDGKMEGFEMREHDKVESKALKVLEKRELDIGTRI